MEPVNGKNTVKRQNKFKMADFLLGFGHGTKTFFKSWKFTCVYQISYI